MIDVFNAIGVFLVMFLPDCVHERRRDGRDHLRGCLVGEG